MSARPRVTNIHGEPLVTLGAHPLAILESEARRVTLTFSLDETPLLVGDSAGSFPLLVQWLSGFVVDEPAGASGLLDDEVSERAMSGQTAREQPTVERDATTWRDMFWLPLALAAGLALLPWSALARGLRRAGESAGGSP